MPLPAAHYLDELATAYVQAVAAAAGAIISVTRRDYGVDGTLKHILRTTDRQYIESGYPVDFQLKGTTLGSRDPEFIKYDLKTRNYDLIVTRAETATPYYLFLVCFDAEPADWIVQEPEELTLKASAFWWTLSGPPTQNESSVRIEVPVVNRLSPETIERMLVHSKERFLA